MKYFGKKWKENTEFIPSGILPLHLIDEINTNQKTKIIDQKYILVISKQDFSIQKVNCIYCGLDTFLIPHMSKCCCQSL